VINFISSPNQKSSLNLKITYCHYLKVHIVTMLADCGSLCIVCMPAHMLLLHTHMLLLHAHMLSLYAHAYIRIACTCIHMYCMHMHTYVLHTRKHAQVLHTDAVSELSNNYEPLTIMKMF